jgi:hypothetical protein
LIATSIPKVMKSTGHTSTLLEKKGFDLRTCNKLANKAQKKQIYSPVNREAQNDVIAAIGSFQ